MYEIHRLIRLLFLISNEEAKSWDEMKVKIRKQDKFMDALDKLGVELDTLLGGVVKFPMADSYAYYIVTKVNKKTVKLTWLDYCDQWVDQRVGKGSLINIDFARQHIEGKRKLAELFS